MLPYFEKRWNLALPKAPDVRYIRNETRDHNLDRLTMMSHQHNLLRCWSFLNLLLTLIQAARSAPRSRTSSSFEYDRIISSFSPEGRLEQVEYSAQAATKTIMAAIQDENQMIVVAPTGSCLEPITDEDDSWIIGTGIAGDFLWLRDTLRQKIIDSKVIWDETTPSVERWVREVADSCHQLTFIAGARPLGATAVVLSWERNNVPRILEVSGWNGVAIHSKFACLGPHQDAIQTLLERRPTSTLSAMIEKMVDVAQQMLGKKESLDVWVLNKGGEIRQYTNIRDRKSRRRLEEWIRIAEETKQTEKLKLQGT